MKMLRKLLFPFSFLYGFITLSRNFFYDIGILKSYKFKIPTIVVGNLSVGGTGKTPQIEYLIRLLSSNYKIATLSRGYKRKSKGFVIANEKTNAEILGDEPFQFYKKFPEIIVSVDENRKEGIENLMSQKTKPEIILLDDAFQHRRVKAGFYILLTTYNDLFSNDFVLPMGNLRESRSGAKRANIIIVTKCPAGISEEKMAEIKNKIKPLKYQDLYFSSIEFDKFIFSDKETILVNDIKNVNKLLLAGIAKPESFFAHLQSENDVIMEFPDHHEFSENDIINQKNKSKNKIIITTEKDYVRLKDKTDFEKLFYLPIKSTFIKNGNDFNIKIKNYVGKNSRNG